jgi:hypothetical protein
MARKAQTTTKAAPKAKAKKAEPAAAQAQVITPEFKKVSATERVAFELEGFPTLGFCFFWNTHAFQMPFGEFQEILKKVGIDPKIAREMLAKNAVIHAVKTVTKGRKNEYSRKYEENEQAVFAVRSEQVHENYEADVENKALILFDKRSKEIKAEGEVADEVKDRYAELRQSFTNKQFRGTVQRYIFRECGAITVREGGGLYFVPNHKAEEFDKLKALFEELGPQVADLTLIPIVDSATARGSMWKSFVGDVQADLKALTADLDKKEDVTSKIYETRIKRYQAIRDKVSIYETVLTGTADELKTSLDELATKLKEKLLDTERKADLAKEQELKDQK